MTPEDTINKILSLKKGERLVYHRGFLAIDREKDEGVARIANAAWKRMMPLGADKFASTHHAHLRAELYQLKLARGAYEYRITAV